MNRKTVDIIKETYRPTKVTLLGNVEILESTSGNIVLKEKKKDMKELYQYLYSRNFENFPTLIDDSREGVNIFEYIPDTNIPKEQKASDFMKVVAKLHQKTSYQKEVSLDEYQKIYDEVLAQIEYLNFFYDNLYQEYFKSIYPSPSEYLLLMHSSKIFASLEFAKKELETWFQSVSELHQYRICQIHNHLSLEHYHKWQKDYLLSWENSKKDSPVLDLFHFYQNEYFDLPFASLLEEYFMICPWSEEEKKLFFIVISIPPKFEEKGSEFERIKEIRKVLDYVYKTEDLIRPYYAVEQK